jgi:2-desacetyl-2-hydroxyethyl bacteriochlorophyllide A dehydrogenase
MVSVVQFTAPRRVALVDEPQAALTPGTVRVHTLHSGISAGTELTAYRGTNPLLVNRWDTASRLFVTGEPAFSYPVTGWGYSEVGRVVEVDSDVASLRADDIVWGIWGHRSEAVLAATRLASHVLPAGVAPVAGVFGRVGAVALNAVLAANIHLGERVAIFGQGVIGLLATKLAVLSGAEVTALDTQQSRLAMAAAMGAAVTIDPSSFGVDGPAAMLRRQGGRGIDVAIELSGTYQALHEAIRCVGPGGTVVAAGFYQGAAEGLRLGEEFHHNQVRLIASQIGAVPQGLSPRWDVERLHLTFMGQVISGALDPLPLVTHHFPASDVAEAFELLDSGTEPLQVVLDFDETDPSGQSPDGDGGQR